jgi:hypothetical protein
MNTFSRILVLCLIFLFTTSLASAQDIIVTFEATSFKAKVLEINEYEIKYKDFENLEGPIYTMKKTDINMIVYQNGKVETFQQPDYNNQTYNNTAYNDSVYRNENTYNYIPALLTYDELMKMTDIEKEIYLSNSGLNNIYENFKDGNLMARTGKTLRQIGIGLSIGGIIFYIYGNMMFIDGSNQGNIATLLGGTACVVGEVLTIVSIPISAVAGGKKRSAENLYRDYTLGNSHSYIQPNLNFGLTHNGIGLSLKF